MGLHKFASRNNLGTVVLALMLSMFAVGCKKKVAATPPPPPPATACKGRAETRCSAGRLDV